MIKELLNKAIFKYGLIILLISILTFIYQAFDVDWIRSLILESQNKFEGKGIYAAFIIIILRSFSIIIPVIPGTYCAVISGYIYGIQTGLMIMFVSDYISCSSCLEKTQFAQ